MNLDIADIFGVNRRIPRGSQKFSWQNRTQLDKIKNIIKQRHQVMIHPLDGTSRVGSTHALSLYAGIALEVFLLAAW